MNKITLGTLTRTGRTKISAVDAANAIRKRVGRKKKKWDSVKLIRAIRDGR